MEKKEKKLKIDDLDLRELTEFIGETVSSSYGVIGLVSPNRISKLLIKKNYIDGIEVKKLTSGKYSVSVHLVLAYGLKITEIIKEVSKKLAYFLKQKYGDCFKEINVYVEDLKTI